MQAFLFAWKARISSSPVGADKFREEATQGVGHLAPVSIQMVGLITVYR